MSSTDGSLGRVTATAGEVRHQSGPFRWGVLGTARIARNYVVPAILGAGDEVLAVASRDSARGEAFASEFGVRRRYDSYDALLDDPDVEAVYIPLPNDLHHQWAIAAAAHKKHVLCEKPLALTVEQAQDIATACNKAGVLLSEAVFYRHHPRIKALKQMLDEGVIGAVRHASFTFTFRLAKGSNIRWDSSHGGGSLYDIGSYGISLCRLLFGREPSRVKAVMERVGDVDIASTVTLIFGGGATASLFVSFDACQCQSLMLVGETGVLRVPRPIGWLVGPTRSMPWPGLPIIVERDAVETRIETPTAIDAYEEMVRSFKTSVREGTPIALSADDAVANLRVLEACRRSALTAAEAIDVA